LEIRSPPPVNIRGNQIIKLTSSNSTRCVYQPTHCFSTQED